MKKLLISFVVIMFIMSCNSNPQATGDSVIMQQEKKDNAIEFQKDSITAKDIRDEAPVSSDSMATKDKSPK